MNENVSLISMTERDQLSDELNFTLDLEVNKLLQESLRKTKKVLEDNRHVVENLVDELHKKKTLSVEEFKRVVESSGLETDQPPKIN